MSNHSKARTWSGTRPDSFHVLVGFLESEAMSNITSARRGTAGPGARAHVACPPAPATIRVSPAWFRSSPPDSRRSMNSVPSATGGGAGVSECSARCCRGIFTHAHAPTRSDCRRLSMWPADILPARGWQQRASERASEQRGWRGASSSLPSPVAPPWRAATEHGRANEENQQRKEGRKGLHAARRQRRRPKE